MWQLHVQYSLFLIFTHSLEIKPLACSGLINWKQSEADESGESMRKLCTRKAKYEAVRCLNALQSWGKLQILVITFSQFLMSNNLKIIIWIIFIKLLIHVALVQLDFIIFILTVTLIPHYSYMYPIKLIGIKHNSRICV